MRKNLTEALIDLERRQSVTDEAAELEQRYGLSPDLALRIIHTASSVDQAHAIAELMR